MKYFLSHCEYIERTSRTGTWICVDNSSLNWQVIRAAVEALANIALAEEDERLPDPAYVQCSDLYMKLVEVGACRDGLTVVGHQCDEDTLDRVFAHRPDWQDWYFDNILDEGWAEEDPYPHFDTLDEVNA